MEVSPHVDVASVASGLSAANLAGNVDIGVLKTLLNLDQAVAAQLAASIGLGAAIDAYA